MAAPLCDRSNKEIFFLLTAAKNNKEKEIPLLKEWKVRNKLTTYTIKLGYIIVRSKA